MRTFLVTDALRQAIDTRHRAGAFWQEQQLVHHCDAGAQYTSLALTLELAQAGIAGSIETVGDALLTGYSNLDPLRRHAGRSEVRGVPGVRVQHVSHVGQGSPEARAA